MSELRRTTQYLLPVEKEEVAGYDIYPVHALGDDKIFSGYGQLAEKLAGHKAVMVDGYVGVRFDIFMDGMNRAFAAMGIKPVWWNTDVAMKSSDDIFDMVGPFLGGDDPIFGFRTSLTLDRFFDMDRLLKISPDSSADINILIGTGAALADWDGPLVYIDIPKNEIQFRASQSRR